MGNVPIPCSGFLRVVLIDLPWNNHTISDPTCYGNWTDRQGEYVDARRGSPGFGEGDRMNIRIHSIESFRVLAIWAVVLWHTNFLLGLSRLTDGSFPAALLGNMVWWFGVPYFCIVAGYFFHQSVLKHGNAIVQFQRYAVPLLSVLLVWLCVYIVIPPNWPSEVVHHGWWQPFYSQTVKNLQELLHQNIRLFLEGHRPVWHLWFLPALLFSLATLVVMEVWQLQRYVLHFIVTLYLVAMGEELVGGSFFNGIHVGTWLMAILLTAIGWWLAGKKQPSARIACLIFFAGFATALMEGAGMKLLFHSSSQAIREHHYLGGIFIGLGIVLFALAKPNVGKSTPLPFLGRFTLGVYASHILWMYTLTPLLWRMPIGYEWKQFLIVPVVYAVAVFASYMIARMPGLNCLVTRPVGDQRPTVGKLISWEPARNR